MSFGLGFSFPNWQTLSGGAFSPAQLFQGGVQGAWYDPSDSGPTGTGGVGTLFSDRAGTTPCAAPGAGALVPVGLMLDKSQGLVLGANIQNGGFDSDTVWTKNGWTISGGTASYASGAGAAIEQASPVTLTAGDWVRVTVTISAITSGLVYAYVAGSVTSALGIAATRTSSAGTYTWYFPIATVVNQNVGIYCGNSPTGIVIDNVSIQKVAGNHAIAANDTTARPELSARVNLLTRTEEFNNAYWGKYGAAAANTTATTDPLGGTTAQTLTEDSANNQHLTQPVTGPTVAASTYVFSFYVKANGRTFVLVNLQNGSSGGPPYAIFNLTTGNVEATSNGSTGANTTASASTAGNGWWRCVLRSDFTGGVAYPSICISDSANPTLNSFNRPTYQGDGTSGIYIWGADLRPANIGTTIPAYQRVADQYTYDTVGFPRYLAFNGTSSAMSTPANVNLSGTDKATVFAGVRKLSDAAAGILCEFSANYNTNVGSFFLAAPLNTGASGDYSTVSRGTAGTNLNQQAFSATTLAPVTNVFTATNDIAGDLSAVRLNGAASGTNGTGDKGAGNFGSYPLYIGARNLASNFLNGNIYSLIVAGTAVSAGNITATEQWINAKAGGVY